MNLAFITCLALQICVVVAEPLANIFKTVNLPPEAWIIVALLSAAPLAVIELHKLIAKD
jgi:hypothetical protein